jgi:hypothetical protein
MPQKKDLIRDREFRCQSMRKHLLDSVNYFLRFREDDTSLWIEFVLHPASGWGTLFLRLDAKADPSPSSPLR